MLATGTAVEGQVFDHVGHADLVVGFVHRARLDCQAQVQPAWLRCFTHQPVRQPVGQLALDHLVVPGQRRVGFGYRRAGAEQQRAEQARDELFHQGIHGFL
ncbi:hypothetical protein D3C80_1948560 [compost metagenome]